MIIKTWVQKEKEKKEKKKKENLGSNENYAPFLMNAEHEVIILFFF